MIGRPLGALVEHVRQSAAAAEPDEQLLERFLTRRDEAAFTALVRRHGPAVLATCRRVLADASDVDDAFQATFLVLFRKAGAIRQRPSVGGWLCGVAHRVAVKARARAGRRRLREGQAAAPLADGIGPPDLSWREACAALHEELDRLPDKFRLPLVLCYLEGMTRDDAARQLGWSPGAVKGQLERGRQRLRARLIRRGVTLSAGLLAAVAAPGRAAVPDRLLDSVVLSTIGESAAAANAAALAQGVLRTMTMHHLKMVTGPLLVAVVLGVGFGAHSFHARADKPDANPPQPPAVPAAAPAKEGQLLVKGRVLNPDGKPVAGAKLFLPELPTLAAWVGLRPTARQVATAGADGRFEFTTTPTPHGMNDLRQLAAVADGYAADWADPAKPGPDGEITLRLVNDDVPIRGRVVDLEGRPVAGATIRVVSVEATPEENLTPVFEAWRSEPNLALQRATKKLYAPPTAGLPATLTTDRDGRFELRGIGPSRIAVLQVEAEAAEQVTLRAATVPGFDPKSVEPPGGRRPTPGMAGPRPGPTLFGPDFVYIARPVQIVTGIVRDRATGKPIAGVNVNASVRGGWWENAVYATTDAEGRYKLVGLPKATGRRLTFSAPEPYLWAGYDIPDQQGLAPVTLDGALVKGVVVTGRITDATTGKPVRASLSYNALAGNAHFDATPGAAAAYSRVSVGHWADADGRFKLVVLPGPGLITSQSDHRHASAGRFTQVRLDPAHKKWAYLENVEGMGESFVAADRHYESLINQSAYAIIDPPAGTEAITYDLTYQTGRTIAGTVTDPDGQPLAGCVAVGLRATWDEAQTSPDAAFTAVALDPDRPRVIAFLHKDRQLAGTVTLGGTEPAPPVVKLQPCGSVTGRVLDEEGKPVAGATLLVSYHDYRLNGMADRKRPDRTATQSDGDGRFRVAGVIPGPKFSIGLQLKGRFLIATPELRNLIGTAGHAKDLGDISTKPYGD